MKHISGVHALLERISETKSNLKRFIEKNKRANFLEDDFPEMCYGYYAEEILESLNNSGVSDLDLLDILEMADEELKCFLCQEKHTDPNCECCGISPHDGSR